MCIIRPRDAVNTAKIMMITIIRPYKNEFLFYVGFYRGFTINSPLSASLLKAMQMISILCMWAECWKEEQGREREQLTLL
jgi:thiosulfate reductase cytochrome b subunit